MKCPEYDVCANVCCCCNDIGNYPNTKVARKFAREHCFLEGVKSNEVS